MRFLHLADVHLDTPFRGRSQELRDRLREASREAFRRAVDVAIERDVHAVIIAGDLLDGERLSFATERFLLDQCRRLEDEGIAVVYATGNHDPGAPGTGVQRIRWPDNVMVAARARPETLGIRGADGRLIGRVTAAGHPTAAVAEDLSRAFSPTVDDGPTGDIPHVAVLHTQVVGSRSSEGHDRYAPSELDALRKSGFDYWALGHVHLRQVLSEDPPVHYPGNPQGRSPKEEGAKGGLLVDLEAGGRADVEFVDLASVRWETLTVDDLRDAGSLEALERRIAEVWAGRLRKVTVPAGVEWIVRVDLRGGSPLWRELGREEELRTLSDQLRDSMGALHVEVRAPAVHPVVRPDEHRGRTDVVGEALRLLDDIREGRVEAPVTWDELARSVPERDDDALAEYARSLLEGADGEILARLLGDSDTRGG